MRRSLIGTALAGVAALALAAPGPARAATASSPWHADTVPLPAGAASGSLHGVSCLSATDCVAAGNYRNGARYFPLAEAWDGSAWTVQRPPTPPGASSSFLQAISCHSATSCWAAGYWENGSGTELPLAENWDGSTWTLSQPPVPRNAADGALDAVSCSGASTCTAAGYYEDAHSDADHALAVRLTAGTWAVQTVGSPAGTDSGQLTGVSCRSSSNCLAVGTFSTTSGADEPVSELWQGHGWAGKAVALPAGSTAGTVYAVSCYSVSSCTAGGMFTSKSGVSRPWANRWNGSSWADQSVPPTAGAGGYLTSVSCVSVSRCTAVGVYSPVKGTSAGMAENWNGTAWTRQALASPATGDFPNGVSCGSASHCTLVGAVQSGGGEPLGEHKGNG
jgi:hypothetical protein